MNPGVPKLNLLFKGSNVLVYYQAPRELEPATIVKVLKKSNPTAEELTLFYHEYEIAQLNNEHGVSLNNTQGIRKVYKKGVVDYRPALYLEHIEGTTLAGLIKEKGRLSITDFLRIAIEFTHILGRIHHHHIIHRDINPKNVIIMPNGELRIIDFGIAHKVSKKTNYLSSNNMLGGTLTYISPEQTGRMNQNIDHRSDLYSLGVTFYEMLTGVPPFTGQSEMDLVYAHIATVPVSPEEINPLIPSILSQIILKLLSKNAIDRYQSTFGLRADLEEIAKQLEQNPYREVSLTIGQKDQSGILEIPNALYGRAEELKLLREAYQRIKQGASELVLVSGEPGSGKSRLIDEIYQEIMLDNDFFISGKYEQFQRQTPYSAIIEAFEELFHHIITLPESEFNAWKNQIQEAVGNNGGVLTEVMPDLELIIGVQPLAEVVEGQESQNRFQRVVQRFIKAISTKENPLVLFLDDLQWADASSLQLLQTMLGQEDNQYFWVIGAYRNNEVHESHPFNIALHNLRQGNETVIWEIILQNLTRKHINALLMDALWIGDEQKLYQLTELMFMKTQGNAFFVNQFLQSLYEEMLLTFSFRKQVWEWDITAIQQRNITDNVIDLMVEKITSLPADAQTILKIAACFGNVFSLGQINMVLETSSNVLELRGNIFASLWAAIAAVFIAPMDEHYQNTPEYYSKGNGGVSFRFTHDHIEQATYSLWDAQERELLHLQIARIFFEKYKVQEQDAYVFTITNHFNKASSLLTTKEDKLLVIRLNQQAAKKAQDTNAYQSALVYYEMGLSLMNEWIWENYHFAFSFYYEYANCAYLTGEFEIAQGLYNELLLQELEEMDKVITYHAFSDLYVAKGELKKAQEEILKSLDLLKVYYPTCEEELIVSFEQEFELANQLYEKVNEEGVLNASMISSKKDELLLKILTKLGNISYMLAKAKFSGWATLQTVNITLRRGSNSEASSAFLSYGGWCILYSESSQRGYSIGQLAVKLSEKVDSQGQKALISYIFGSAILHWASHQRNNIEYQHKAIMYGLESGNNFYASAGMFSLLQCYLLTGYHLEEVKTEYSRLLPVVKKINPFIQQDYVIPSIYQPLKQLLGEIPETDSFDDDKFSEVAFLATCTTNGIDIFYTAKVRNLYIFNHFEQGAKLVVHYDSLFQSLPVFINVTEGVFYIALHLLAVYQHRDSAQQKEDLELINRALKQLEEWAIGAPMNFGFRALLVLAEKKYLVEKKAFEAINLYEQAIKEAAEHEYNYIEAIAHERVANLWLELRNDEQAKVHLDKAFMLYKYWGAKAKVKMMKEQYPYFLASKQE